MFDVFIKILKLMLNRDSKIVICSILWTVNCDLVIWTQPSGPLCLWQCFCYMGLKTPLEVGRVGNQLTVIKVIISSATLLQLKCLFTQVYTAQCTITCSLMAVDSPGAQIGVRSASSNTNWPQQRLQPVQNFWVYTEFLSFFVSYSRLSESFGKMGQIDQIWGWKWVFLHLEGWKTTKYHIYTLILQCSCH